MTTKTKVTALLKRILMSRIVAVLALIGVCYALFNFAVAAVSVVEIRDGNNISTVVTTRKNADDILEQAQITIGPHDEVDLSGFHGDEGAVIQINRSFHVTVINGDKKESYDFIGKTVGDALTLAGFTAEEKDVVLPSTDTALFDGITISIDKIRFAERVEAQTIPYESEQKETSDLFKGQTKTDQKGAEGEKQLTYSEKYVNEVLTETVLVSEVVTKEPVKEIVLVGTMEKPVEKETVKKEATEKSEPEKKKTSEPSNSSASNKNESQSQKSTSKKKHKTISDLSIPDWMEFDENGLPTNYSRIIEGKATAYTANPGDYTASGRTVMEGYVAVNPKQLPYGTKLYIVSTDGKYDYGYAIAADTGGFAKSGSAVADLFFNSESACNQFGRRNIRIYVFD